MYRIFLSRNMTAEGVGLYQIALSVIGVLITLSSSGIPITVSRLMIKEKTSNNEVNQNKVVTAGIFMVVLLSLPICILSFIFKDKLGFLFADKRCVTLFLIIVPGVVLTSVYAVIRGFFWGMKSFYTYSVIELLEELVMILCGTVFILRVNGIFEKAMWASFAVLISYVFSFTLSFIFFIAKGGRIKNPKSELKPLIHSSMPITFMRTSNSLTSSLVAIILPLMLIKSGISQKDAISQFGILSGMTMPLIFIPSTIIGSLALVLSPVISENYYKNNIEKIRLNIEKSLLYSLLVTIFIIPVFVGSGKYIGVLLFNNELAGKYLEFSAFIMIPMAITMISNSLLNSIGFEKKTLIYFIISSAFMLLFIVVLPPFIGNYALILGYFVCFLINSFLSLALIKKVCGKNLIFFKKLAIIIPVCIIACFLNKFSFSLLKTCISEFLAFSISFLLTDLMVLLSLVIFNIISIKKTKKVGL